MASGSSFSIYSAYISIVVVQHPPTFINIIPQLFPLQTTQADQMVKVCTTAEAAARSIPSRTPSTRHMSLDVSSLHDQLVHVREQHARLRAHQRSLAEQLASMPPLYDELQEIVMV